MKEKIFYSAQNDGRVTALTSPYFEQKTAMYLLDQSIQQITEVDMGEAVTVRHIKSDEGPFLVRPEYRVKYPPTITRAISRLYEEYNMAFGPLVEKNREWDTDYQYCLTDGKPVNRWVQIDMVGLPEDFLAQAVYLPEEQVREAIRPKIFEIENSLAMYQLLQRIFARSGQATSFELKFRQSLDRVREQYRMPIALLAVTEEKYLAMKGSEFGARELDRQTGEVVRDDELTEAEIKALSGFDAFFGPKQFEEYLANNNGKCDYLLYARTSDPVTKLRKPGTPVENPLLSHPDMRRIIKAHTVTFNIDNPEWSVGDLRRINDTKEYLPTLGMGFAITNQEDLDSEAFTEYLRKQGIDEQSVAQKSVVLRAKPMQASYGCYGHERGTLNNSRFLADLRKDLRQRGPYVIQPELDMATMVNKSSGERFTYIDRNFFSTDGVNYTFMGGFRSSMSLDAVEASRGRVHGSNSTVWSEIY